MGLGKDVVIVDSSIVECCICYTNNFTKSFCCDYCDFWTCESCLLPSTKTCPKCKRQWPKNPRRNYTVEKLIDEANQMCCNYVDGCGETFAMKDTKKKEHEEHCQHRKGPCPLSKILGCAAQTSMLPKDIEKHFTEHHRLDSVYLHDQERETEFFRMTMMSPLPKGTETSCLLLKQEEHTIIFVSTGEGVYRSFLFLFVTPPPKKYQIRVYGSGSAMIKINDKPQIWADICETLPLVSFTITQQQYLKWSHSSSNRSFTIHLRVAEEDDEEDDDEDDEEEDDEEDEDEDDDEDDDSSNDEAGSSLKRSTGIDKDDGDKQRYLKKLKVK
ncbi:hypothetical protein SAMD00019534_091400 [Acytostelium subglobosum LB1]|uniref:hypothetical protein n=1 Tax=Acytostelium subglobosum LB1 TaxID=1410327 RepID=UPI000644B4D1|nr:hypothetical protein SAMD00019534_091400 [Acytostelium subglobosum LB1]GAM25965.1 hypothetical protein SAMD00019534_091400 [Acytostelium subglobosum LB1]|eukprot:XP_012751008.1 hypothetical protein SAMD00019534_091400 [Acytostelium subglobosum LB1]